jgi:serine/threonine-protein kinase
MEHLRRSSHALQSCAVSCEMDARVEPKRIVGRYALFAEIASGGMATVHLGRLTGAVGFSRTVAVKRLHQHFAKDPEFVSMFLDEARLAARIRHPNVVPTLDVVAIKGELFLVMEYVHGETLSRLVRAAVQRGNKIPPQIVVAIMAGVLHGLHAAHQAKSEFGQPLGIVHRDVSPQNVLVGTDGVARVLDFGIAKAAGRLQTTRTGQLKGKLPYMAPEQILAGSVSAQTDIYSAAVVIWEALTGRRLFPGNVEAHILRQVLHDSVEAPSKWVPDLPPILDQITLRGLRHNPAERFASAREMAVELERAVQAASASDVGDWVEQAATKDLITRAELVSEIECYVPPSGTGMTESNAPAYNSAPPTATMQFPPQSAAEAAARDAAASAALVEKLTTYSGKLSTHNGKLSTHNGKLSTHNGKLSTHNGKLATLNSKLSSHSALFGTTEDPRVQSTDDGGRTHNSDIPTQSAVQTLAASIPQRSLFSGLSGMLLLGFALGIVGIGGLSLVYRDAPASRATATHGQTNLSETRPQPVATSDLAQPASAFAELPALEPEVATEALPAPPKTEESARPRTKSSARGVKARQPAPNPSADVPEPSTERPKTACSPPFTVDSLGVRHIKPECI